MTTNADIENHNNNMEKRLKSLLEQKNILSDEEANKLGRINGY